MNTKGTPLHPSSSTSNIRSVGGIENLRKIALDDVFQKNNIAALKELVENVDTLTSDQIEEWLQAVDHAAREELVSRLASIDNDAGASGDVHGGDS